MPGAVYLYQGEELGLPEWLDMPDDVRQDPVFANTGGAKKGRDGCRVPLPWTADPAGSHGFSPAGGTAARRGCRSPTDWGRYAADGQDGDDDVDARAVPPADRAAPRRCSRPTRPSSSTSPTT